MSKPTPKPAPAPTASNRSLAPKGGSNNVTNHQIEEMTNQVMDLRLNLEGLEKERDFYFSKLRDIEILCQEADESETSPIISKILDILYATEVSFVYLIVPWLLIIILFFSGWVCATRWIGTGGGRVLNYISEAKYHFYSTSAKNSLERWEN